MKNTHTHLMFVIIGISLPAMSFAFFCPTNFSQIDFGMTTDQVTQACGKPDSQKESTKTNDNIPQEWSYYIPQTVSMGGSTPNQQGTLKTSVTFDDKGKAINISVNGIGVGATTICGSNIQLGDSRDAVKSACGDPSFVNKQSSGASANQQATKVVEYIYSSANPPTTLIFEDGKLTDKK
ncbi:hypothetical protein AQUSIP_14690 [Aquicella siphonis]|uniref:Uncharacterized protein n=1 Tax=Aquicella siphonis TaxID=254247 RepID=A0A5E4PGZ7_9COXI|nr:DUF2845 domain-containing protein [Aquicella siphonis]VVC76164.1 hypothetical protein AQUSIP_14690 [Aquicella siphonis]